MWIGENICQQMPYDHDNHVRNDTQIIEIKSLE